MSENKGTITVGRVEESIHRELSTVDMQSVLRQAIFDAISEQDVKAIITRQVELAKKGDQASLQFVMRYVLGFGSQPVVNQMNVIATDPATAAKIAVAAQKNSRK